MRDGLVPQSMPYDLLDTLSDVVRRVSDYLPNASF
jgi:hypothetical protein